MLLKTSGALGFSTDWNAKNPCSLIVPPAVDSAQFSFIIDCSSSLVSRSTKNGSSGWVVYGTPSADVLFAENPGASGVVPFSGFPLPLPIIAACIAPLIAPFANFPPVTLLIVPPTSAPTAVRAMLLRIPRKFGVDAAVSPAARNPLPKLPPCRDSMTPPDTACAAIRAMLPHSYVCAAHPIPAVTAPVNAPMIAPRHVPVAMAPVIAPPIMAA